MEGIGDAFREGEEGPPDSGLGARVRIAQILLRRRRHFWRLHIAKVWRTQREGGRDRVQSPFGIGGHDRVKSPCLKVGQRPCWPSHLASPQ